MLRALWHAYLHALRTRPVATKALTSGLLAALSDILAQRIVDWKGPLQLRRVVLMALFGCMYSGPSAHVVHRSLDHIVATKQDTITAVKKVILEQLSYGPLCNGLAIFYIAKVVEGRSWKSAQRRLCKAYPTVQLNGWKLWPLVALVNYKFVPINLRVLFVNLVSLFWSCFLIVRARSAKEKLSLD